MPMTATLSFGALLKQLGEALNFPDWYGANFDALHDCLTDPDCLPGGHDPDLRSRPGENEIGTQTLRVHRDDRPAVRLAEDHRQLRDPCGGERPQQ